MKTTINLDDNLMEAVRERARRQGVTVTSLIADALRRALVETPPATFTLDLPVTLGRRPPSVDIDSTAVLEEYFDRRAQHGESG